MSSVTARELRDCAVRQGLLDAVASDAGVELYYLDCGGRIVDCNPAAERALGRSIAELEGRPLFAAYSGWEDPDLRQQESLAVIESGRGQCGSIESVQRGGDVATVRVDRLPLTTDSGRVRGLLVAATARLALQEAASEEAERFRLLAEHLPGIVYLCRNDERWSMLYISGQVQGITGYPREDFLEDRVSFIDLYHPDDSGPIWPAVEQALASRSSFELSYRIRHRSGEWRWIWEHGSGVYRQDRLAYLEGYLADVTSQRASQAERDRLLAELARKNSELERFTYTVSHELKSPVVTVEGFAGLLQKDLARGDLEAALGDLQSVRQAASTMHRMLDDLLQLSRRGHVIGEPVEMGFGQIVERALERLAGRIEASGGSIEVSPDLPRVYGAEAHLVEVVQNLVENALRYHRDGARPRVEIGALERDGETALYVRDDGVGIEPAYLERVFGLFEQLDGDRGGNGIGLALVRRIVETHGGRVWVESDGEGRGATFLFTLPGAPVR